jgi:membrane associated rhomboid family serine protease
VLIVPLHRRLTLAIFPWVTLALVLVNALIYFGLQSRDDRARMYALEFYTESRLGDDEFPLYREWLKSHEHELSAEDFVEIEQAAPIHAAMVIQSDGAFLSALDSGTLVPAGLDDESNWRERRAEFNRQWQRIFTERWIMHFDRVEPLRWISAAFLHGSFGHLLGNMVFLAVLGLLVEGALGPWRFLLLYLLGGIGASLASQIWNWGSLGGALGASGAIAALMGAYCVLWGKRRVRFFWWFFVVFDYVRAPALMLLPFWMGWELLNLALNRNAGIGFDAHAGGMISGALLALGARALGWERRDFMDEDEHVEQAKLDRQHIATAREHLGRLEISQSRMLLEPIAQRQPKDIEVLALLYHCARYESGQPKLHHAALTALAVDTREPGAILMQRKIYADYVSRCSDPRRIPPNLRLALARRCLSTGDVDHALQLLRTIELRGTSTERLANELLAIVQVAYARGERQRLCPLLEMLIKNEPESESASKARLLLEECAA